MAEQKPDSRNLVDLADLRILLVEDNEVDRSVALAMLNKIGSRQVQVAETGSLAMAKIQNASDVQKPFDLILLDAKMPSQDGIGVLKWLRNQPKVKATPVIMITATSNMHDVSAYIGMGISGYVVKPLKLDVLRSKLSEAIAGMHKSAKQAV